MRVVLRGKAGTYTHRSSTEFPDQVHHVLEPPKRWLPFAITYAYILHGPYTTLLVFRYNILIIVGALIPRLHIHNATSPERLAFSRLIVPATPL